MTIVAFAHNALVLLPPTKIADRQMAVMRNGGVARDEEQRP